MNQGIFKSERFQSDLQKYKSALEKVSNDDEKKEIQKLLDSLIINVKRMDNMYLDMVYSNQITSIGSEMREKITEIRKKLDVRLKNNFN